jgi:hypothetical protein
VGKLISGCYFNLSISWVEHAIMSKVPLDDGVSRNDERWGSDVSHVTNVFLLLIEDVDLRYVITLGSLYNPV